MVRKREKAKIICNIDGRRGNKDRNSLSFIGKIWELQPEKVQSLGPHLMGSVSA